MKNLLMTTEQTTPAATAVEAKLGFVKEYNGIPYEMIINNLLEMTGGIPAEGARYNTYYVLSSHLRYICDNNPDWIDAVIPNYGLVPELRRSAINSACKNRQSANLPQILSKAIASARLQCQEQQVKKSTQIILGAEPPEMPARLPKSLATFIRNVPTVCRPATANGVFAPLAAHLFEVRFPLIDNTLKEATFMCMDIARQSSGKASINKPVEYIMADIKVRDDQSRAREQEWKEHNNSLGANKDKERRPKGLCIQTLIPDATNAAFLQRVKDAEGHSLYTCVDEIDELYGVKTNGKDDICKLLRLSFDNAVYGQERVGTQSVSGEGVLRWQINASGTIEAGRKFFRNHLHDGTFSRMSISTIISDDRPFEYGTYDERYANDIAPYIARLNEARGVITCKQALALAKKMLDECDETYKLSEDTVFRNLSYRAVTIAYLKAMVLYIMQGKWSKEIEAFADWALHYDLWCKFHIFGEELYKREQLENIKPTAGPENMLAMMPRMFLSDEAYAIYRKAKPESDMKKFRNLIARWKSSGFIAFDAETSQYYKTQKYFEKHDE